MKTFAFIQLFSSVLLAGMALPTASHGGVITAGELVVDLRAMDLTAGATTWTNKDTGGATVGNFVAKGGGSLGIAGIGGINRSLFVNTDVNKAVVSALNAPSELLGNNTRSVEVWVYPVSSSATSAAVGWGTSGNSLQSSFNYNTGGNGMFSVWNLDTGWNGTLGTGNWIHLAYTFDGTTLKGYTNGVLNKSIAFGPMATASAKLGVGAARAASADGFKGYIADVRVHTGVLSGAEVSNNYNQGIQSTLPAISGLTNQTIHVGGTLVLAPAISGFPDPALRWSENGIALPNMTNASLTLASIQAGQSGHVYSLIASNAAGKVTNGMTLTVVDQPVITGLSPEAVYVGSDVTFAATVTGLPTPTLKWLRGGSIVANGATGNGSTISGATTSTLFISNAQSADSTAYSLVASNSAGVVTNTISLTVSATDVAPGIVNLNNQTVVQGSNATFTADITGLPFPALQWQLSGTNLPNATNASLVVSNVQYAQNGSVYSMVASNSVGAATDSATLFVLVPASISQPPTNTAVLAGTPATFGVVASGVPVVTYRWSRNGSLIANATNASYTLANPQGADNGAAFAVTVSNSVGVATSGVVTLTVLSPMTGSFLPTNGAVNLSHDQQLRIVFSGGTPKLTYTGKKLHVRDVANNALFATIDTSLFQTFATDSATVSNAFVRSVQGQNFYYMPIAIYGNEAWLTLNPTNRFAYGKTYYVTCDTGLFVDAAGASFPGVTGTNTWRFSTKASGPATATASSGPTNITVALDGAGDFATLQGASDWIPQNNVLKRTINILPGTYRDFACFYQNRSNVVVLGTGASRADVEINYPNAAFASGSSCGLLRVETTDMYFRNFTLDNEVYLANSLNNYGPWAGRLNTLVTTKARVIFDNVIVKGGQDTYYANGGIAYFNRCEIWGSTDFIYGQALAVFDRCNIVEIKDTGGPINAPSTVSAAPFGLVFLDCQFPRALIANGYPYNVNASSTTFMRPWGQDGHTAIINCTLGSQMTTIGWGEWGGREATCRAREYGTMLSGGGSVTPAQRQSAGAYWLNTHDPDYAPGSGDAPTDADIASPTGTGNRLPVTVNPADYTLNAIFGHAYYGLGGWRPTLIPTIMAHPTNKVASAGSSATFSVAAVGMPDPTYQWRKDGTNIAGATNATFSIPSAKLADNGVYHVMVSNSAGSIASSNAILTVPAVSVPLTASVLNGDLQLSWPPEQTGFRLMAQTNAPGVGLTTNWQPVANSAATNHMIIPLDIAHGSAFFQLVHP
jgi:pectin methylesterase-like acyl-CoA thioesterase